MGVESLDEEVRRVLEEGPPLEWYLGIGKKDEGILKVGLADSVCDMGDGQVRRLLDQWEHFKVNPTSSVKTKKVAEVAILEAERVVKEVTGYSPRELIAKREVLTRLFKGKKEAPFAVELY